MTVLQNGSFTGFIPELLQVMSQIGGFTYTFSVQNDGVYGKEISSGTWNGMVGDLLAAVCDSNFTDETSILGLD